MIVCAGYGLFREFFNFFYEYAVGYAMWRMEGCRITVLFLYVFYDVYLVVKIEEFRCSPGEYGLDVTPLVEWSGVYLRAGETYSRIQLLY